jgi:hypothetical protein
VGVDDIIALLDSGRHVLEMLLQTAPALGEARVEVVHPLQHFVEHLCGVGLHGFPVPL